MCKWVFLGPISPVSFLCSRVVILIAFNSIQPRIDQVCGFVVLTDTKTEIACWMYTGERQASTLRKKYLEAVLRQDVGFFDTDARTGDIVFSVSTDTLLVQDAISEKVRDPSSRFSSTFHVLSFGFSLLGVPNLAVRMTLNREMLIWVVGTLLWLWRVP